MERTPCDLRHHYEIEKELAARLKSASKEERRQLYSPLYDELFRRVSNHPQLVQKQSAEERLQRANLQLKLLKPFLRDDMTFMEIGPGDCALSQSVAKIVRKVYAFDVSKTITGGSSESGNCEIIVFDGYRIPLPDGSVDIAYSNQLMEHLHPDDAAEQLADIYRVLKPKGMYVCITPNRLSGPHDVSKYFDKVATGFHLKEYTNGELSALFWTAGFRRTVPMFDRLGRASLTLVKLFEVLFGCLPLGYRQRLSRTKPVGILLGVRMLGIK